MIDTDFPPVLAKYNQWQNKQLYEAAACLPDTRRRENLGAFFGSIHATLSHLVWADKIWLHRFSGRNEPRGLTITESVNECPSWHEMQEERIGLDCEIIEWAASLSNEDLTGDLSWDSAALGREVTKPRALLIAHFFNHQTHHRGQVHAMLTASGQKPGDTDLPFMP